MGMKNERQYEEMKANSTMAIYLHFKSYSTVTDFARLRG